MPGARIELEDRHDFVLVRVEGMVALEDFSDAIERLAAEFRDQPRRLWDLRRAIMEAVTSSHIRELAHHTRRVGGGRRRVALLTASEEQFGLTRMFESFVGEHAEVTLGIFRSDEQGARAWLCDG